MATLFQMTASERLGYTLKPKQNQIIDVVKLLNKHVQLRSYCFDF